MKSLTNRRFLRNHCKRSPYGTYSITKNLVSCSVQHPTKDTMLGCDPNSFICDISCKKACFCSSRGLSVTDIEFEIGESCKFYPWVCLIFHLKCFSTCLPQLCESNDILWTSCRCFFFCHGLLVQSIPHKSNNSDLFFFLILQVQGTFSLMSLLDGINIRWGILLSSVRKEFKHGKWMSGFHSLLGEGDSLKIQVYFSVLMNISCYSIAVFRNKDL